MPPKWGTNGERTNFWSLFRVRAPLGHPWGTPGGQNGPKTSPKSLRDPPEPHFFMIVGICLTILFIIFDGFSDVLWSLFGVIFFIAVCHLLLVEGGKQQTTNNTQHIKQQTTTNNKQQTTLNKEQRTKNNEQRTKNKKRSGHGGGDAKQLDYLDGHRGNHII